MSETVIIPTSATRSRGRSFIPPLLIVPFVIYNIVAFALFRGGVQNWEGGIFGIGMVSGTPWWMTAGDLLLVLGLVCLFVEILKSTRTGSASIVEHMLSTLVFVLFLVEFLLVGAAATSVFFILMLMSLMDVVAGFSVSITSAGRDVTMA